MYVPDLNLDFVEVRQTNPDVDDSNGKQTSEQDEFEFPLFSFGTASEMSNDKVAATSIDSSKDISPSSLMKVSLREPDPERFVQERPLNYYFSKFSDEERQQFLSSAVDYEFVLNQGCCLNKWPQFNGKILDLNKRNADIESLRLRALKKKRRRPGKKQRDAKKEGALGVLKRQEILKEVKKLVKKKFHKRGGKKNKKKEPINIAITKPTNRQKVVN